MQQGQTPGRNGIWDLFIMFSASYTIFQVMIAGINLIMVYSNGIGMEVMKRVVLTNLILWISSLVLFSIMTNVAVTIFSNSLFVLFILIAYILIARDEKTR